MNACLRLVAIWLGAVLVITGAAPAHAACTGALTANGAPSVIYDPFAGSAVVTLTVNATKNNNSCDPALIITGSGSTATRSVTSGAATIAYTISNASGTVFPNSASSPLLISVPNNNVAAPNVLTFTVAGAQIFDSGTYSDTLTIRLVDTRDANNQIAASSGQVTVLSLSFTVSVPSKSQVNIAGSSGSFGTFTIASLSFGALAQGTTRNAFVQIRSTAAVTVTLSSANAGSLKRVGTTFQSTLAYSLSLNGANLNLATGPKSMSLNPARTIDGTSIPMAITISGSPSGLPAGLYQDVLTVDVVP